MIELIQFPWSPFCIVQRRILEYAGARFKICNIPNGDRSLVWKLAKYLDQKFSLGLFPAELEGVQTILWRHIENDIEGPCFKLTDIHWRNLVPKSDRLFFVRHKERKFGRGCLDQWRAQEGELLHQLEERLAPFEEML